MTTSSTKKRLEEIALALRIDKTSEEMSPCRFCVQTKKRCVASGPKSTRCSECVRHRKTNCDFTEKLPSVSSWASLDRQRRKLRDEEEEAMMKIIRLRKQQQLLDDKEQRMIELGVSTLEELDAKEKEEQEESLLQEARVAALTEASAFLESPFIDPEAFEGLPESF
ncbi:hypothetical protein VE04_10255 [Pseudogymnoascus sp. 24MN13]|nr:hypothetical protein VE04_10255 [Pseudogymnoascus sp. 24MN13]